MSSIHYDKKQHQLDEINRVTETIYTIWNYLSPSLKERSDLKQRFQKCLKINEKINSKINKELNK